MIWKSVPDADLSTKQPLAEKLATLPTKAIALTKEALNRSLNNTLDGQLEVENELQPLLVVVTIIPKV